MNDPFKVKAIVPLVDTIEGAVICHLLNQNKTSEKVCFVAIRDGNPPDELNRYKELMNFLHENNKENFFHYVNLEKTFQENSIKYHSDEMNVFFGNISENLAKNELKNSILRYLHRFFEAPVIGMHGKTSFIFKDLDIFFNFVSPIENLNKTQIYDVARKNLPKDLIMYYAKADIDKLKELPFENITYSDLDFIVDELKDKEMALKKSINSEYNPEQNKLLSFILQKSCN